MPKPLIYILICLTVLAMIPPAIIARARVKTKEKPRIHIVQDMDNQPKYRAQHAAPLFADNRAMRPVIEGTVARGELHDEHRHVGLVNGAPATTFPDGITVDLDFIRRGQERFNIFCTPCHGHSGYGDGIIHKRATALLAAPTNNGTVWVPPKSLHESAIREQPIGQIFNSITNGVRNMAGYKAQIPVEDRWAIVAYVKALQRSQFARQDDVPAAERADLPKVNKIPPKEGTP